MREEDREMHMISQIGSGQLATRKSLQDVQEKICQQDVEDDGYEDIDKANVQKSHSRTKTEASRQNTNTHPQQNKGRKKTKHADDYCPGQSYVCKQENGNDRSDYLTINRSQCEKHQQTTGDRECWEHRVDHFRPECPEDSLYANSCSVTSGTRYSNTLSTSSSDSDDYVNITGAISRGHHD
jgi:hypothetical protein